MSAVTTVTTLDPIESPCTRAAQLRKIRDNLLIGGQIQEAEMKQGNGVEQRVRYSASNLDLLDQEIAKAERLCALQSGSASTGLPKRHAVGPMRSW